MLFVRRLRAASGLAIALAATLFALIAAAAQDTPPAPMTPDIPAHFDAPEQHYDFTKREVMIPMRDGVKLHTVIVIPRSATASHRAPIILTRTPYNASGRAARYDSPNETAELPMGDEVFAEAGYIRVFQDVRGKYGSEGDYVMTRPLRGPLNPTRVDHSTDAWDTIDWLVRHLPESNGRVGMIGSSYEGFTVLMALVHPHPALRAAVPMSPMVDGWRGDDWFHNGAFRQVNFDYIYGQTSAKGSGGPTPTGIYDDYDGFLRTGSADDYARLTGIDQLPFYQKLRAHPAYDGWWQGQALDQLLAKEPLKVPTLFVAAQWDQEDMYGAIATYEAREKLDVHNDMNFLALGPWRHSGVNYVGRELGPLKFDGDTALEFRRDVMQPFLDRYLCDDPKAAPTPPTPPVFVYETGADRWERLPAWPVACASGCAQGLQKLYLQADAGLGFTPPPAATPAYDVYVSDPAKPVPYQARPVHFADDAAWKHWLVNDQRPFSDRPDVLTYTSAELDAPVKISGAPLVHLLASTSGTDSDWVVKLIDVYPDEVPSQEDMGGYQLGIAMDIFRGRYRDSLEHPSAIPANSVQHYDFALPNADHVFLPGHRIMVQIQSSWFPLYDRNPQTYISNIFTAKPADYQRATQRVYRAGDEASYVALPVVPETADAPEVAGESVIPMAPKGEGSP